MKKLFNLAIFNFVYCVIFVLCYERELEPCLTGSYGVYYFVSIMFLIIMIVWYIVREINNGGEK